MEARYYEQLIGEKVQCKLCPHNCIIAQDKSGICKVRSNIGGSLYSDMYGFLAATHFDPIEKKPLYHYYPGTEILSLGALGCNFHCTCCQNYEISQTGKAGFPRLQELSVQDIIKLSTLRPGNLGVAYTYNEPFVWYEFMYDIAQKIKMNQGRNVVVSNGYVNKEPLHAILPFIDAFNIDIKAFDNEVYRKFAGGELNAVLENLEIIAQAGKHLEITLLIVPGVNDVFSQFKKLVEWIAHNLGKNVPLHLSRYFPHYKLKTESTSLQIIDEFADYAQKHLSFVYTGNIARSEYMNTFCPDCGSLIIQREGYYTRLLAIDERGNCSECGRNIAVL